MQSFQCEMRTYAECEVKKRLYIRATTANKLKGSISPIVDYFILYFHTNAMGGLYLDHNLNN